MAHGRQWAWMGAASVALALIVNAAAPRMAGGNDAQKPTVGATAPTVTAPTGRCRSDLVESIEGRNVVCRSAAGQVICIMPLSVTAMTCPPNMPGPVGPPGGGTAIP